MSRISLLLVPLLILGLLLASPMLSAAAATKGAAFTTVDPAVDGSGHCANGNPSVNCNQYDGKQFVWLNGGPQANHLRPDGKYFFAVLDPGGQPSPNDGAPKNLSSPFDAYTNRTFTITNGEVSAYTGTHWFDSGKHVLGPADGHPPFIRLFPYANTDNPGGVYIMAICSLANGYPVKAQDCKYDAFKVRTPANVCVPQVETADFTKVPVGSSVQGLGVVAPDLNISALFQAVHVAQGLAPVVYTGHDPADTTFVPNGGLTAGLEGFSDYQAFLNIVAHHYTFTFKPGVTVTDFSLHMLDFGDYNPTLNTTHFAALSGFDANNTLVAQQSINYTTPAMAFPTSSNLYGNLHITGDALASSPGDPGNWTWHITGANIVKVKLDFGAGYDPNFALNALHFTFTSGCP